MWVVALAPLAFIFFFTFRMDRMSAAAARTTFFAFAAVMGASLSTLLIRYTGASVVQVFFITAASFGALSLYGYTTSRSLSAMGSFLMMGLIGLLIVMLVNIFLQSPALQFAISALGVLIFAGLTAYDTQKLKEMYIYGDYDGEAAAKASIFGALTLYLDFINMFQIPAGAVRQPQRISATQVRHTKAPAQAGAFSVFSSSPRPSAACRAPAARGQARGRASG